MNPFLVMTKLFPFLLPAITMKGYKLLTKTDKSVNKMVR